MAVALHVVTLLASVQQQPWRLAHSGSRMSSAFTPGTGPVTIVVQVEIEPSRISEFMDVIEKDVKGSLENENGGCLRFDVMRDQTQDNVFRFYEAYVDSSALDRHKQVRLAGPATLRPAPQTAL